MIATLARTWASLRGRRYGDWTFTADGAKFWPLDPRPEDFTIAAIARGLATECRYGGQIGLGTGYSFFSVAEHSVIVSLYAERRARELGRGWHTIRDWAMNALLHDASEAFIGDIPRPLKLSREFRSYGAIERRVTEAIECAFDLAIDVETRGVIAELDNRVIIDEIDAFVMLPPDVTLDYCIEKYGAPLGANIAGLSPAAAEHVFLQRYNEILEIA